MRGSGGRGLRGPRASQARGSQLRVLALAAGVVVTLPQLASAQPSAAPYPEQESDPPEQPAPAHPAPAQAAQPRAPDPAPAPVVRLDESEVSVSLGPTTGLVVDAGDTAHLELHLAGWVRTELVVPPTGDVDPHVEVPLARLVLKGGFFHNRVRFFFQPEFAGTPHLLDLTLSAALDTALVLRIGQFRTPFGRSFNTPIVRLTFPDRGLVSDTFRLGRDTGIELSGGLFDQTLVYAVGVFNGARVNGRLGDLATPTAMARLTLNLGAVLPGDQSPAARAEVPLGVAIGVGGAYRRWRIPEDNPDGPEESAHGTVDLTMAAGPFSFTAEGYVRDARTDASGWEVSWGAFAQAAVFVHPWVEVAARGSWIDPSVGAGGDFIQIYEASLNLYPVIDDVALGHHLKLSLRYGFQSAGASFGARVPAGDTHRVTLLTQLWM